MPMERMLPIYFMQQWFNLSDPASRTRYMTPSRCAGSHRSSFWTMRCRTSRQPCAFATGLSSTISTEQIFGLVRALCGYNKATLVG